MPAGLLSSQQVEPCVGRGCLPRLKREAAVAKEPGGRRVAASRSAAAWWRAVASALLALEKLKARGDARVTTRWLRSSSPKPVRSALTGAEVIEWQGFLKDAGARTKEELAEKGKAAKEVATHIANFEARGAKLRWVAWLQKEVGQGGGAIHRLPKSPAGHAGHDVQAEVDEAARGWAQVLRKAPAEDVGSDAAKFKQGEDYALPALTTGDVARAVRGMRANTAMGFDAIAAGTVKKLGGGCHQRAYGDLPRG